MNINKSTLSLLCAIVLFWSCSKEPENGVALGTYKGSKTISFNNYGGYTKYNTEFINKWDTIMYEVKIGNTTGTASAPIKVSLAKNNSPISEYNTVNGTSLQPIPISGAYLIDDEITIPAGKRTASFRIAVNPTKLAGGSAIGIQIMKVEGDGAAVLDDILQNRLVVEVGALNQYDGVYSMKGELKFHPTYAGPFMVGDEIELRTSGASSVDQFCTLWDEYCQPFSVTPGNPTDLNRFADMAVTYTIDQTTNAVTVSSGPGNATALEYSIAGYNNRYVPATKTMYVSWGYKNAAGALRQFIDTLTFVRKR